MKQNYTLDETKKCCEDISKEILKNHKISHIVSIGRGGFVPSRYMAKYLNVRKIYNLGLESYSDETNTASEVVIYQPVTTTFTSKDSILIVDDICDTFNSLQVAYEHLHSIGAKNIYSFCLHAKQSSLFNPTYIGTLIEKDDIWICYDWE